MSAAPSCVVQGVALLAAIIGGERRAERHAPMLAPGARSGKYYTVHSALSDRQLAAHLTGCATFAAVLVDHDGLAAAGVVELDHGSDEAAGRVRVAALSLGVHMFSIVVRGAGTHDGSHSWALFAERAAPERIKALMQAIVTVAGLPAETETQLAVLSGGRAVFFSPRCRWAPRRTGRNGRPVADSFDLFTTVEHRGDKTAALRALRAVAPRVPRGHPPPPEEWDRRQGGEAQAEVRRRDAERKRTARKDEAATTLQAVRDRAAEDGQLAPCERAVLYALLECAGTRDWCRPSKARLCELSGYALGSVKRALMRLEARAYFASQGDGGSSNDTAIRTFLRGSSVAKAERTFLRGSCEREGAGQFYVDPAASPMIHESIGISDSDLQLMAGEGGSLGGPAACEDNWTALFATRDAAPPLSDPAAIDAWWVDDGLCAVQEDELPTGEVLTSTKRPQSPPTRHASWLTARRVRPARLWLRAAV